MKLIDANKNPADLPVWRPIMNLSILRSRLLSPKAVARLIAYFSLCYTRLEVVARAGLIRKFMMLNCFFASHKPGRRAAEGVVGLLLVTLAWPTGALLAQPARSTPIVGTAPARADKDIKRAAPTAQTGKVGSSPKAPTSRSDVGPSETGAASNAKGVEDLPANAITVRSLIVQRRLPQALQVAEVVLRRYPNDLEVAMQRARLLFWLGKPKAAEKAAVTLYKRDRRNHAALRLVGEIRQRRGDRRGAIRAYREAQLRGDPDVVLAVRLISLYLDIRQPDLALAQVRPGMPLSDELAFRLANARYPWRVEAWAGMTLFNGQKWQRGMANAAYTWSPRLTLMGGVSVEDRGPDRLGVQLISQLFFSTENITGDVRLALAPMQGGYLPAADAWAEAAYRVHKRFAVGLWARYASYQVAPLYTIGPYIPIYLGRLTLKPGYLFVVRGLTVAGDLGQIGHTVFLRARWQHNNHTAVFAWTFWGQEAVFNNRTVYGADESGPSLVLGWDQWLGARVGFRLMGTAYRHLELGVTMWDVIASVRFRL